MGSAVSMLIIIILKIKGLMELLGEIQGDVNNDSFRAYITCLSDLIEKTKGRLVSHPNAEKILELLDMILIEIKNDDISTGLSKIITELQMVCNSMSSICAIEKESASVINRLLTSTKTLFHKVLILPKNNGQKE